MTGKNKPDLEQRFEELDAAIPVDEEEAGEILANAGLDPEAALSRLMGRVDQAEDDIRHQAYQAAQVARQEWAARLESVGRQRPRAELLAIIDSMKNTGTELQAMYKNLDEVTDEDLESLVRELEALAEGDEEA